jgi:hypothetical protein
MAFAQASCADMIARWIAMVERIDQEVVDLLWQREQIRMIGKMIEGNPTLLNSDKPFLWEARRWFMVFAAMAVRRQSDRGTKLVSIAQLLTEIRERSECVTRGLIEKQVQEQATALDS